MAPVVIIRPLSGYANRLQAIVSAELLAAEMGAALWVVWEPSEVAPVPVEVVLGGEYSRRMSHTRVEVCDVFSVDPCAVGPYLRVDDEQQVVTLAGLDRGEQAFMPQLRGVIATMPDLRAIVISAGGKFTLEGDEVLSPQQEEGFRQRRREAYASLQLSDEIEARALDLGAAREPYVGLHLRYSDRSAQTPWAIRIGPALGRVTRGTQTDSVFVASDSPAERLRWVERTQRMGLTPWVASPGDYPRSDPRSAVGALIDWRLLTRARGSVFFSASSFAEEAAVASGTFDQSVGLEGSRSRALLVNARQVLESAATYPSRHGWMPGHRQ